MQVLTTDSTVILAHYQESYVPNPRTAPNFLNFSW